MKLGSLISLHVWNTLDKPYSIFGLVVAIWNPGKRLREWEIRKYYEQRGTVLVENAFKGDGLAKKVRRKLQTPLKEKMVVVKCIQSGKHQGRFYIVPLDKPLYDIRVI